jgi:hypothetical protein
VDEHAANDLDLFAENEGTLARQHASIIGQLKKHLARGTYDPESAVIPWTWWYDAAALEYVRQNTDILASAREQRRFTAYDLGGPDRWARTATARRARHMFPTELRHQLAVVREADERARILGGEWGPLDLKLTVNAMKALRKRLSIEQDPARRDAIGAMMVNLDQILSRGR